MITLTGLESIGIDDQQSRALIVSVRVSSGVKSVNGELSSSGQVIGRSETGGFVQDGLHITAEAPINTRPQLPKTPSV
jgi:hypothetical protein